MQSVPVSTELAAFPTMSADESKKQKGNGMTSCHNQLQQTTVIHTKSPGWLHMPHSCNGGRYEITKTVSDTAISFILSNTNGLALIGQVDLIGRGGGSPVEIGDPTSQSFVVLQATTGRTIVCITGELGHFDFKSPGGARYGGGR